MVLSKLKYLALLLTLAAGTFCCAGVKEMWTTDVTKIAPHSVSAYHGEDISLECKMHINGKLYNPFPYYARFQWQTNGMGNVWWEDSATISGGIISKTFTPYMDGGANKVAFFFSIVDKTGASYRINGSINFLSSPGGDMHELPLPTKTLDFKWIDVKNPELSPFALSSESEALYKVITNVVRSAAVTNAGAVNKSKAYADSRFLPLTGGTLTSNLVVNGNVSASNITLDSVSSIDFNGCASYSHDEYGLILENDSESIRFSNTNKTVVSKLKPDGSDILTKTVADGLYEPLGGGGGMSPSAVTNIVKSAAVTNEGAKAYSDANMRSKPDMNVYVEQYANWTDNAGTVYVFSSHIGNDIVWTNGSDYVIETLNTIESWRWSMSKNGRTAHSHDAFPEDSLSVSMSNSGGDYWVLTRPYYVRILKDSVERLATEKYATSVANAKALDSFVAGTNYTDSAVATRQTNLLHTVAQNGKILGCINETLTWVENGGGPTSGVTRAESTNIAHSVVSQDVAGWAMKGQPKPTGMTTNAVIDIASSSSVTNAGAVSVATDMFEELDYWKRDYGDRTWEEERYTPWYIRYAKDPSGNYDEVLEGILDEYSITTNGVFYYPRPGVGGWWSRYGNEPTDAYVINSVVESGPAGAQATVIEAIYTRKSDGVQITVDSFRVFIRGEDLLITSDLDRLYLHVTNLYSNLSTATQELLLGIELESYRAKKAETNIAHCATNYTDAAATASTNYTDEVAIKKGGESRVYDDILLKGEDGSTVLQRVDSEWRFGGGSDYADKLYNQDTYDAIYLEDGKWYIGVETTPIKKEISTIDDLNATNALLSAELANEKYERETADTKFLTKASTSYPSTRQLKWQGYDLVLLGPMRFDGWSSIKAGTTSPGTTLPEYLKEGSWNTATDPFAKKSDIVSASSVTNIAESASITNGGAKAYADDTFLVKTGKAADADKLDGNDSSYFATKSDLGNYLPLSGNKTVTGDVLFRNESGTPSISADGISIGSNSSIAKITDGTSDYIGFGGALGKFGFFDFNSGDQSILVSDGTPVATSNLVEAIISAHGGGGGITTNDVRNIVSSDSVTNAGAVTYADARFLQRFGGTVNGILNIEGNDGSDSAYIRLGKEDVLPGCFWLNPYGGGNASSSYGDLDFYWPDDGVPYASILGSTLMRKKDVATATSSYLPLAGGKMNYAAELYMPYGRLLFDKNSSDLTGLTYAAEYGGMAFIRGNGGTTYSSPITPDNSPVVTSNMMETAVGAKYLPLAGGTVTGDIEFGTDSGNPKISLWEDSIEISDVKAIRMIGGSKITDVGEIASDSGPEIKFASGVVEFWTGVTPDVSRLTIDNSPIATSNMMENAISAKYLQLGGGTMTGSIVIDSPVSSDGGFVISNQYYGVSKIAEVTGDYGLYQKKNDWTSERFSEMEADGTPFITVKKAETDYPVITNAYTKSETDAAFAKKLTGKEYDFEGGTNFTLHLYTALTNVIQEMGGTIKNPPIFQQ